MTNLPTGTVTLLFTDIERSTLLLQHLGDRRYADVLEECRRLLRAEFEKRNGQEVSAQGDAFLLAFSRARDAVEAAVAAQRSLATHLWPEGASLRVRMGLHTGEPISGPGDYAGLDVHRASRICSIGHGGQILASQAVGVLVSRDLPFGVSLRDLGAHRLKDLKEPERLFQVVHRDLPVDFPPLTSLNIRPNNLPIQLTSFVGRAREIAEVKRLLLDARLVTLTGSGGAGKTRLALQVAADTVDEYRDGVWFVEFAPIGDPQLVPRTLASALNVPEQPGRDVTETLREVLEVRSAIIILDNCEHLTAACAYLAEALLRGCPDVRVLATSREALGVTGETIWRVPALSVPDPQRLPSLECFVECEAIRLFVDRAAATEPQFAVTTDNARAIAQVCHRLDGMPLAIELAAARVKVLTVEQIAARLEDRFRLLRGGSRTAVPRQQTLRATMDWSYELLSDKERTILRRLSVFSGGWSLEAAEAICASDGISSLQILDLLVLLVDKSLVSAETRHGDARYRLLETIRQYAWDRLAESGEDAEMRRRHRDWYVELAERAEPKLRGRDQEFWLSQLELELDNLRGALECSLTQGGDAESGMRLSAALGYFWWARDYFTEGSRWLERAVSCGGGAPAPVRAKAFRTLAYLLVFQGQLEPAAAWAERAVALSRQLGDKRGIGQSLWVLGWLGQGQKDRRQAEALLEESLVYCREAGDDTWTAIVLNQLGEVARSRGDHEAGHSFYEKSLAIKRAQGDKRGVASTLANLGYLGIAEGDYQSAVAFLTESLKMFQVVGSKQGIIECLGGFAEVADRNDQPERVVQLLAAAQTLLSTIGARFEPHDRVEFESLGNAARIALGDVAFETAWALGHAMTLEKAIEYALGTRM